MNTFDIRNGGYISLGDIVEAECVNYNVYLDEEITSYDELIKKEDDLFRENGIARHELDVKNVLPEYIDHYIIYKRNTPGLELKFVFVAEKGYTELLLRNIANSLVGTNIYIGGTYFVTVNKLLYISVSNQHSMNSFVINTYLKDEDLVSPFSDQEPKSVKPEQ